MMEDMVEEDLEEEAAEEGGGGNVMESGLVRLGRQSCRRRVAPGQKRKAVRCRMSFACTLALQVQGSVRIETELQYCPQSSCISTSSGSYSKIGVSPQRHRPLPQPWPLRHTRIDILPPVLALYQPLRLLRNTPPLLVFLIQIWRALHLPLAIIRQLLIPLRIETRLQLFLRRNLRPHKWSIHSHHHLLCGPRPPESPLSW